MARAVKETPIQLKNPNNDIFGSGGPAPFFRDCAKEKDAATESLNLYRESILEYILELFADDKKQADARFEENKWKCAVLRAAWSPFDFPLLFDYDACITTAQINHDLWVRLWEIRRDERLNALNAEIIARLLAIQKSYVQCCASLAGMGSCSRGSGQSQD